MKTFRNLRILTWMLLSVVVVIAVVSFVPVHQLDFMGHSFNLNDALTGLSVAFVLPAGFEIKSSQELKEEKRSYWDKANTLFELIKTEKRSFTAEEKTQYDDHLEAVEKYNKAIEDAERRERVMRDNLGGIRNEADKQKKLEETQRYSLLRAISLKVAGKPLDGIEAEMHQEAENETRTATGKNISGLGVPTMIFAETRAMTPQSVNGGANGSQGGVLVATEIRDFIDTLRPKLAFGQLGVTMMGNLIGNISIPKKTGNTNAEWVDENDDLTGSNVTLGQLPLKPRRLGALAEISKQLLQQTSYGVDAIVKNDILTSLALALELAALTGAQGQKGPGGILTNPGITLNHLGDNGAALAWANIVNLETFVSTADALIGNMAYLVNAKTIGKLKSTPVVSNFPKMLLDSDGTMNGYKVVATNTIPSNLTRGTSGATLSPILFGNFSDLVIAQWGGLDLILDPVTKAGANLVKIVVNAYFDAGIRHEKSFAAFDDVVTV